MQVILTQKDQKERIWLIINFCDSLSVCLSEV
jgi:hypothetical protein